MSANTLNFKANSSLASRMGAAGILLGITTLAAAIVSYLVSGAIGYVDQPPFTVYQSKVGNIAITYPTGMVLKKQMYGSHIDSATFSSSRSTIDNFDNNKGEGLLLFVTAQRINPTYRSIDEEVESEVDTFKKAYFYENPEEPNELKEAEEYATINRKEHTETISGHEARIFDITQQGEYGYRRDVLILIPSGDILYQIKAYESEQTSVLDDMLDSIKIGAEDE